MHHQLKQHRGLGLVLAHIADVINDDQVVAIEAVERLGQVIVLVRLGTLQLLHQRGGGVEAR